MVLKDNGEAAGWVAAEDMAGWQLAEAVRLHAQLEARVAGMRMHVVAAADRADVASEHAATDTAAWAAKESKNRARSWGGVWLANQIEALHPHVRSALAEGQISEEHAAIIVRAAEKVPDEVDRQDLLRCEDLLVGKAMRMNPVNLRRAARRLLEPLGTAVADRHEEAVLREQEQAAEKESYLMVGDNGDGTYSGRFTLPALHASILIRVLETLSAPRRTGRTKAGRMTQDDTVPGAGEYVTRNEAFGAAFCELLEHLPPDVHPRTGVTVVVHVDEDKLRAGAGSARLDTGEVISISEARRLACDAGHLPQVLRGRSVVLDQGHRLRLFTTAQWLALSALHETCAAEGCERPFAWSELHHLRPWSEGGPTDLDNAIPLCGWHHRRIHDDRYDWQRQPDGSIQFQRHWRRRRVAA